MFSWMPESKQFETEIYININLASNGLYMYMEIQMLKQIGKGNKNIIISGLNLFLNFSSFIRKIHYALLQYS